MANYVVTENPDNIDHALRAGRMLTNIQRINPVIEEVMRQDGPQCMWENGGATANMAHEMIANARALLVEGATGYLAGMWVYDPSMEGAAVCVDSMDDYYAYVTLLHDTVAQYAGTRLKVTIPCVVPTLCDPTEEIDVVIALRAAGFAYMEWID